MSVKILTGDNDIVTAKICTQVGLSADQIVLGTEIERLSDDALAATGENTTIFAKVSPQQKARVIKALQRSEHVVGFLGDGINDSLALKAADVGISPRSTSPRSRPTSSCWKKACLCFARA